MPSRPSSADIGSHPVSEGIRRRIGQAMLAVYFALAPSSVPAWRLDPVQRIAAVLAVGEPTPSLWGNDRDLRP